MTSLTPEQKRASDPEASVWVAASAGTGKTYVLTSRVLRILLQGIPPERLLCLTFTKAAAAQMANRINRRLGVWVVCDEQLLCAEIEDLTGGFPDMEQRERARKLFAEVLEVPGGLKIQTIHSFCQSLLGRFPLEAGIAPHFQVMDERTTLEHLARARDAVLGEAREDINPPLARALAHISRKVTEVSFAELIGELIGERSGLERLMGRFRLVERAQLAMGRMLGIAPSDSVENIAQTAGESGQFDEVGLRLATGALQSGSDSNQKMALKMARWLADPDNRVENFASYKSAFLTAKGEIRKSLMPKKLAEKYPAGLAAMAEEAARLLSVDEKLKSLTLLENSRALLRMGAALLAAFGESKKNHAVMDYDDLILKVTDLVGREGIADWILYKLDGGLDHILIDEAQDTNPEQWQVVKALANEFFVGEGQAETVRTIFAVGDVKQSIYSFQRADPKEFVENRAFFQEKSSHIDQPFYDVSLDLSFRSTAAVLSLVDRVFEDRDSRLALSFSDLEITHQPSRTGEAGLVEIWPTEKAAPVSEPEHWQPPVIQQPADSPEMKLAVRIADRIGDWLKKGEPLTSQGRDITAGDIMILVRRRTRFDDYMIRALKARNIPVAGQDKMLLTDQIAVMDLLALGNFVLLPGDDLTLATVLKSPLIGFGEEDLFTLAHDRRGSLWSTLLSRRGEQPRYEQACAFLQELSNFADTAPPFEFYSHLLATLGGRKMLLGRLGEEANDPIDEFLQLAMGYEAGNISSLQGFLSWVERGNVVIKRDMEQAPTQVRIMTIHGAKGLQAPIVFLPDCCQLPVKSSKLLWAKDQDDDQKSEMLFWPGSKDYELGPCKAARERVRQVRDQEYLRLLYVAMTRAGDRLYITGWEGRKERNDQSWYDMILRAFEKMDQVVAGDTDKDDYLYRLTCPQKKPVEIKTKDVKPEHKDLSLPLWAKTDPGAEPSPSRPLSPSRPEDADETILSPLKSMVRKAQDQLRFHRGRLIHRLLEILPEVAEDRRQTVAQDFLGQSAYALSPQEITRITGQVMGILTNSDFAGIFSRTSRAEVPIIGLAGSIAISGQVDRLVVTNSQVMIIDYKTNRPPPEKVADVSRLYLRQMAAYRAVLRDIYPDKTIKCLLLWTDVAWLMPLPDSSLDQITFG